MKLIFNSISKSYGNNKALDAFSAELGPGIHALLGPNGSGKSTLMNIITGNLKADEGSVIFSDRGNSEDIRKMGNRFSAMLGFMPQYPGAVHVVHGNAQGRRRGHERATETRICKRRDNRHTPPW